METVGLYVGSFDPVTLGHLDIVSKAMKTFDKVIVGKGFNPKKKQSLLHPGVAAAMIAHAAREALGVEFDTRIAKGGEIGEGKVIIRHDRKDKRYPSTEQYPRENLHPAYTSLDGRLHIGVYEDDISAYAKRMGATHLVRGLRQVSDFNDEFTLHGVMREISPELIPIHIICDAKFLHVSSSTVRELAKLGYNDNLDWLVTPTVKDMVIDCTASVLRW
jgi:pantetheine-phosphate adenylyltransferase